MENKKRVLVIEDEAPLRNVLGDRLERDGFSVTKATNGKEGLEIALREHPDLILLDIIMPVMDGITMLRSLRADGWGKTVPVIVLTNLTGSDKQLDKDITEGEPSYYFIKTNSKLELIIKKAHEVLGN